MQPLVISRPLASSKMLLISVLMTILIISGFNVSVRAQNIDSLKKIYSSQVIFRYGQDFKKGEDKLKFADLKHEFQQSSVAYDLYTRSRKNRITSSIMMGLAVVATIAEFSFAAKSNKQGFLIAVGAAAGSLLLGAGFNKRGTEQLDQALFIRNKELLFK